MRAVNLLSQLSDQSTDITLGLCVTGYGPKRLTGKDNMHCSSHRIAATRGGRCHAHTGKRKEAHKEHDSSPAPAHEIRARPSDQTRIESS